MATLIVRQLDEALVRRLKERAAAHGRSAEAEHRAILEEVLAPRLSGSELWRRLRTAGATLADEDLAAIEAADQPAEPAALDR
ncbi:MAG: plasmid stabilization protein [Geminicoccaceae bacterium]|nr:plasmid stabilization protein [Geminicoccaceae bacterium]